ncbi:MAG: polyribonucleotide nucleotidyltransferase [Candidatus Marinimicrobia bacterium]|nr:polyribonucleotide nucleotidyltransferase [Candidatus Neomarinimicrobiota bacterium]
MIKTVSQSTEIGNKKLTLEVGRLAEQANAAVLARYGDTMVLATVVSAAPREDLDYLPLYVEYLERLYAGGRIKGSRWVKREGRPSDEATLTARLVDRSVRPLFAKNYKNEIQVMITVLSVDGENDPDMPAVWATSAALAISDIPWEGPVGAMRIGYVPKDGEGSFIINPTYQDLGYSIMNLIVSGPEGKTIMLEGEAQEISEEILLQGIEVAEKENQAVIQLIKALVKKVGQKKQASEKKEIEVSLVKKVTKDVAKQIDEVLQMMAKGEAGETINEIKEALAEKYEEEKKREIGKIVDDLLKKKIREQVVVKGKRLDGRKPEEIRPIEIEVGLLPRTHGSAMFKRGQTQALTVTTLGSPSLGQLIENMEGEETKRYIHHYYMPPFSMGETGRIGWPSRREVGHGALAEKALLGVIPSVEKFPYTIRVVSEIMSSNGSTSMAAVCGSTLSLMDAGVPIKAPVAGVAMGLIEEGKKQVILTDIFGLEDFNGDMDFKLAGTEKGMTSVQMDVKNQGIDLALFKKIVTKAKEVRLFILKKMMAVMPVSRIQISQFAPKIKVLHLPVDKIGEVIGPGGKIIRGLIRETGAAIDVEDDGTVNISAPDKQAVDQAVAKIEGLTREVKVGEVFEGEVKRIQPFGAFVEILPGKDGLVHVSKMATKYVTDPNEVVKIGDKVKVKVVEIDDMGRLNLSMIMGEEPSKDKFPSSRSPSRPNRFPKRPFRRR